MAFPLDYTVKEVYTGSLNVLGDGNTANCVAEYKKKSFDVLVNLEAAHSEQKKRKWRQY